MNTKKTHILISTYAEESLGGGETSLINLIECLSDSNYKIELILWSRGALFDSLKDKIDDYIIIKEAPFSLQRFLHKKKYDLSFHNHLNFSLGLLAFKSIQKAPKIIYYHGPWQNLNWIKSCWLKRHHAQLLCPSKNVREQLNYSNSQVCPPLINVPSTNSTPDKTTPIITVGIIGRFQSIKNQLFALEVLQQMTDIKQNINVKFVGSKPHRKNDNKYYKKCITYIEKNKDHLPPIEVHEFQLSKSFYRTIDIIWVPSKYESFGMVAAEALCMGIPCITANVGGLKEVMNGYSDYVYPENNKKKAEELLKTTITNIGHVKKIFKQKQNESKKRFNNQQLITIINKALTR